jgi:prepilin-type N-terminal cleavage/methylation domain-containing protein
MKLLHRIRLARHMTGPALPARRQAFTLVELLVVIAIIGLLSTIAVVSLNSARSASRDAKRKADLRQISQAVELYLDVNGSLPPGYAGWCTYIANPIYTQVKNQLLTYLPVIPTDPTKANQAGDYLYFNLDNINKYALCANLESATGNSYNYAGCADGVVYNYCLYPNGQ